MRILVTGGAGFIGSNFIHYYLKKYPEDHIINLDALTYAGNLENLKAIANYENYSFIKGDICDQELINTITNNIDLIINFAAETHVDRSVADSAGFIKTNIEGTRVLLEAAKEKNIRFHHISTDEVFGHLEMDDSKFNEETPHNPRSPYSASKAAADHLVRAYFHTHNTPITISNCSNNYGPYQHPEKLIPNFITKILTGRKLPLYGEGKNIRDWIHVDDHNRGVDMIIKKGKIGESYCLGGGNELTNLELTKKILKLMDAGEDQIEFVKDRPGHDLRYAIDYSKIKNDLGWNPEIDFEEGLRETIKWYKNNKELWLK